MAYGAATVDGTLEPASDRTGQLMDFLREPFSEKLGRISDTLSVDRVYTPSTPWRIGPVATCVGIG
jgi:hypothetical protein